MSDEFSTNLIPSHPAAITALRARLSVVRRAVMRPPPRMNVPDWADTYRHLSTSAGAVGGPWQTHRVEVARGAMMSVTEPGVRKISAMISTQTMKTELLMNTFGYYAHLDPCPILLLEPKDEMADAFSKERVAPMIQSSPELRKIMGDQRSRNGDDTLRFKRFPGGFLAMTSAGSPTNLAMRAIRVVLMDEIDKYESTKEGDPVSLAEERTATFGAASLAIRVCSPTWEETSRIFRAYLDSDQRRPYCQCPECQHWQTLDFFRHVNWNKTDDGEHKPETAEIFCEECGVAWTEAQRLRMMTTKHTLRFYQTRPFTCCDEHQDPQVERLWEWEDDLQVGYAICKHCLKRAVPNRHAGFQASKLYSPFTSIVELASKWIEAKDDPETKQTFYNTQLGIPYRVEATKEVGTNVLAERKEVFDAEVPEGVVTITMGADVQPGSETSLGRIECEIVGWGVGEESWSLGYHIIQGDPALPQIWEQLDKLLLKPLRHVRGFDMFITAACVDSGGHNTQEVYKFARPRIARNVWAIKGASDRGVNWSPVWPPLAQELKKQKFRLGWKPILLGVNSAKEAVRQKLLVEKVGPSFCHFPPDRPDGYFLQLTAERLIIEKKNGVVLRSWRIKKGQSNEALDCRVYAYSALVGLYHVRRLDLDKQADLLAAYVPPPKDAPAQANGGQRRVTRSGFMG